MENLPQKSLLPQLNSDINRRFYKMFRKKILMSAIWCHLSEKNTLDAFVRCKILVLNFRKY